MAIPENLRRLVPDCFGMEAYKYPDGEKIYAIIKTSKTSIKHVDLQLMDEELSKPDEELMDRYLKPACSMLGVRL